MSFPPIPTYPLAIDTNKTLYLVHNTSEAKTRLNNNPWADQVDIDPVGENDIEIWADNGFANISGEMFYYDTVGRNQYGKVNSLKRCCRNLAGKQTKFNKAGTWVRGFVVADHHNQLVQALINIENFIGVDFDDRKETLDFRIRNLNAIPLIEDDHGCPDVTLDFFISTPASGESGATINYNLTINGFFKNFRLEFGDGDFTTSSQVGTHTYAPNSSIDPIVIVSNDTCQMVQTGIERTNPKEPNNNIEEDVFEIDIPEPPEFPPIVIPNIDVPQTTLTLPQINFPIELGVGSQIIGDIPSVIILEDTIPDVITVLTPDFPSNINVDVSVDIPDISVDVPDINVTWDPPPDINVTWDPPPDINVTWDPPPDINVTWDPPPVIGPIEFGPVPSIPNINISISVPELTVSLTVPSNSISVDVDWGDAPTVPVIFGPAPVIMVDFGDAPNINITWGSPPGISVDWGEPPGISVDWGEPPACSCTMTVTCPGAQAQALRANSLNTDDFQDPFLNIEMDSGSFMIPEEINLIVPKIPNISVIHDLPEVIYLEVPKIDDIRILGPETPIPSEIRVYSDIPSVINLVSEIPSVIEINFSNMPTVIQLEVPSDLLNLKLDTSGIPSAIQVVGIPDSIELKGYIPSEITLKLEENLSVPLVFNGPPIPVQFDFSTPSGDGGLDEPCFRLVRCGN